MYVRSLRALPSYKVIDFHKVEGLKGAYIASQINSVNKLESFITFDKGGVWQHLVPPSRTYDGHPVRCEWVCLGCIDMFINSFIYSQIVRYIWPVSFHYPFTMCHQSTPGSQLLASSWHPVCTYHYLHACVHVCVCMCVRARACVCRHLHTTHTHTHTHMHACMHTHYALKALCIIFAGFLGTSLINSFYNYNLYVSNTSGATWTEVSLYA